MRIFVFLGTILVIFILFTGHVLLVTKDAPDDSYLPSLESSISMLSPMTAMPQLFTPKEQTWIDEHPVITVSMTPAFVPSSDPKQINAYSGISLDYLRLLSRIIGVQFRIEPQSNWTTALEDAKQWRTDLFAMVEPTLATDANLLLTKPHILLPGVIVVHEKTLHAASLKELSGKHVSVVYRHFWHNYLESRYPDIILDPVSNPLQGLFRVMSGHSDALVDYKASVLPKLQDNAHLRLHATSTIPSQSGLSIGVRSDWPELHSILAKALNQIQPPERELINNRWLERQPSLHLPPRTFWTSLLGIEIVLSVLLLIIFWNVQLRRKVEERTARLATELEKSAKAEDLQRLNTELQQAMKAADAATEAKSRFLANISHEIRTPLHGIISFTELAYLKNNPLPRNHQRTILDLSYALLDIVNDTLDFSKIEAGEMDMDTAPFMLDEVLLRVCDMTMRGSMARELECLIDIDPSTPIALLGDAGRLQQILTNLMGNAVKFTPPGGRVHLQVRRGGNLHLSENQNKAQFLFFVHDTGVGIAPDQLPQLFQPFKQADSSLTRRHGGTGLGLSIARYMVENMGGEIWVESEVGQGSTFAFSIRLALQEQVEVLGGTTFMGLQAIVISSSETGVRIMRRTLEALGIQCQSHIASKVGPLSVLASLGREPLKPDLIIIDRLLGEGDCPPALRLANELQLRCAAPVPLMLVGGPREGLALSELKDKPYPVEVIPAITVRCVRSTLRKLLDRTQAGSLPRPGQSPVTPDLSSVRLLVAEDNPVNQEIMTVLLEETHAQVKMANNGIEALKLLERETFDLMFLDIQMPGMDGYETIKIIRERGYVLPVVALTAHAMQADKQRCLDAGMDAYLSKPFKQALLFDTIHNLLPERYRISETQPETGEQPPASESWAFLPSCFSLETVLQTGLSPRQYPAILQSFARNHAQDGALFRHSIRTSDWESLRDRAHALKGASANLGALILRDAARTLELEAQAQLDKGYPGRAPSFQGRPLSALLPELEEALGNVLEAAAKLCPISDAEQPSGPSATASKPTLDVAKLNAYYNDLVGALQQAAPGRIRIALSSLLVICNADEYPLLHTLKMHVDNYDYEAALTVLEKIRPSLLKSSVSSTEPSDAVQ
ncbi:response regulator [uncultured Bilophila sp.]|uniref:response regulator n=1 Tax=uncultured Bilophila sp. TaxID=529385 RepID=UPI0025D64C2B|nr:response regulator [uncultured Bilophila sp.]